MNVISSTATTFYKATIPKIIYGGVGVMSLMAVVGAAIQRDPWMLGFPVVAMGGAVLTTRMQFRPLADEVRDMGDHLVVRRDGVEDRIALSAVERVGLVSRTNFIRLTLAGTSAFGRAVTFVPHGQQARSVADGLAERAARAGGRAL
jgi:hypothetical protein